MRWDHFWGKRIFRELVRNRKNQYLMINSTLVRADQQAATGHRKGANKASARTRVSDDEDLRVGRRAGPVAGHHDHRLAGCRLHQSYRIAR